MKKSLIITVSKYGYELKTHDDRFYFLERNGKSFLVKPLKIKRVDQMGGTEINFIPNEIKSIVFQLNKKPEM